MKGGGKVNLSGRHMLRRLIWIQAACFGFLIVFFHIDDEYFIPRFLNPGQLPLMPTTLAGILDSLGVVFLFLLTLLIQLKFLNKIRLLEGMISVCAHCKKIRDEHGHWSPIEEYIQQRSHADFSHGICPECGPKLYGDLYRQSLEEAEKD